MSHAGILADFPDLTETDIRACLAFAVEQTRTIVRRMISGIRDKISAGRFEFSRHAVDQSILRRIAVQEVREAVANAKVIEDYPEDKYGPSCLILGFTSMRRPLHIQCSYPSRPLVKIITLYEPDPILWIDFETRRD